MQQLLYGTFPDDLQMAFLDDRLPRLAFLADDLLELGSLADDLLEPANSKGSYKQSCRFLKIAIEGDLMTNCDNWFHGWVIRTGKSLFNEGENKTVE